MALNTITVNATPDRVWEVLSDPACYPRWVVGARAFRGADAEFPAVGSRFHHCVALGPWSVKDETEVLDVDPPWRIELQAKARPFGTARIALLVQPRGENETHVTLIEDGGDPLSRMLFTPLTHLLVRGRNAKGLERLKALIESVTAAAEAVEARQKRENALLRA